jgi:hypothetical protein
VNPPPNKKDPMIHDIALQFSFSNRAQIPVKGIQIRIAGETISVEPEQNYGPVFVFLEENELISFQPDNGSTALSLQWTENNKLVPINSSAWKNKSKKNNGHFELPLDTALLIIRYEFNVKNRKTIALKFSAHTRDPDIDPN